jgi:hypothetical protein
MKPHKPTTLPPLVTLTVVMASCPGRAGIAPPPSPGLFLHLSQGFAWKARRGLKFRGRDAAAFRLYHLDRIAMAVHDPNGM